MDRGETPSTPSYKETKRTVAIASAITATNQEDVAYGYDDDENTAWGNDNRRETAWITYKLARKVVIDEISLKLGSFRRRSYPLEIYAGDTMVWQGNTEKSLGYIRLALKPVMTDEITIKMKGATADKEAFGQIVELSEEKMLVKSKKDKTSKPQKGSNLLRIIEIEFMESLN